MDIGTFKRIVRTRCNNNPMLTNTTIRSLFEAVLHEICLKGQADKTYVQKTLTQGIYLYAVSSRAYNIRYVKYGTITELDSGDDATVLIPGVDYEVEWQIDATGGTPYQWDAMHIRLKFNPDNGKYLRVFVNHLRDNLAQTQDFYFDDAQNLNRLDYYVSPLILPALMDGIVAYFKQDIEKNPLAQLAMQKYIDTLNEILAVFNEDVETC